MGQKIHAMHGRDHLPTGADPIPGLTIGGGSSIIRGIATAANFSFNNYAEITYDTLASTDDTTYFALASNRFKILKGGFYYVEAGFLGYTTQPNKNTQVDFIVELVATAPTHVWSNGQTGLQGPLFYTGALRVDDAASVSVIASGHTSVQGYLDIIDNTTLSNAAVFKVYADWTEDNTTVSTQITRNWITAVRLGDTAFVT